MRTSYEHQARTPFNWSLESTERNGFAEELKKKELILQAATTLFANKGYSGTSVREIVEAAGVTKPTLYYYFKNKDDLYNKLIDEAIQIFFDIFDKAAATPGGMRTRLFKVFAEIYHSFRENIDFLRLVNSIIYGPRGAVPEYDLKVRNQQFEQCLSKILRDGIAEGELGEADFNRVMLLLVGLLRSLQVLLVVKPVSQNISPDELRRSIDLIFDGTKKTRNNTKEV
ncbi:MAG: TetR/AcrR family transcriptional regulator [Desulfoferrobacter sp.]